MSLLDSFKTERNIPVVVSDLAPVAHALMEHFRDQEYDVSSLQLQGGGWQISLARGGFFQNLLGLRTALNVRIETQSGMTYVSAGAGLFELQALPTVITVFIFSPLILAQIWGLIQQEKLDDEAVNFVESYLRQHASGSQANAFVPTPNAVADNI